MEQFNLPTDYYSHTKDWFQNLERRLRRGKGWYRVYVPEHVMSRRKPGTPETTTHWKFMGDLKHKCPEAFVAVLPNGRIWGQNGVVISPDNKLVSDVSIEFKEDPAEHSLFRRQKTRPPEYTADTVAVIASVCGRNYYHWMFDILPRLCLLKRAPISIDAYAVHVDGLPFQEETLDILGVKNRLYLIDADTHLMCANLVVPSLPGHSGYAPKWTCTWLRQIFLKAAAKPVRDWQRIYISRNNVGGRRVVNEAEVVAVLAEYGFNVVTMEWMTVRQQARLLASAEIVVAAHGGGLTNLVFCRAGTKVVEFFSPNYVNVCYWSICNHVGLNYHYLIGEGARPPEGVDPKHVYDDITVHIDSLRLLLESLGLNKV